MPEHSLSFLLLTGVLTMNAGAARIDVTSPAELRAATAAARPGDEIVIRDGSYRDWDISLSSSGTAPDPVVVRAQTPGQVRLSGNSRLGISGDYVTVSGLCFQDGRRVKSGSCPDPMDALPTAP